MDENLKNFCKEVHNRLKSIANASIKCVIDDEKDIFYVNFSRLGIDYDTSIKDISSIVETGEDGIEKCVTKVIKSYRNYINHKFFY